MNSGTSTPSNPDDELRRQAPDAADADSSISPDIPTETLTDSPSTLPRRIGQYHIKRVIASGGMGTVYEATQEKPRRAVALKLMKHGIASRSALRRFEYESQILARLRHPGIAQVFDADTHKDDTGTTPYFAMEYIPNALPITKYANEKKLGTRQRMELFSQVCDAVHHGHQKGIIHRDLKPSNILVDSNGQVKIIDFGVARSTDSDLAVTTLQTDVGQLIGTLQYMSPEQCQADPHDIDTRSDVYALGVVFYELLCQRLPYDVTRVAMHEATRIIREEQPTKLTTINKTLRGDIETIALKALEKERDRRYQSATDFGQDIQRYLNNEAITARRASMMYHFRVLVRRNKPIFGAIAAVFVVLVAGLVVSTSLYLRAEDAHAETIEERDRAVRAEATATAVNDFLIKDMLASADPEIARGRKITVEEVLDSASQRVDTAFRDQPEIEASIRDTIGTTYVSLGLHEAAEPHLLGAESTRRRLLGDEHPDTLQTRAKLADLLRRQGWFVKSESLARETLEFQRRVVADDDPTTAFTLNALGLVLRRQGRNSEANEAFREALDIRRRILGEDHPDTLTSMNSLSKGLGDVGFCAEAETLYRKTIELRRRTLGVEHPRTLESLSGLGPVLRCVGRRDEAEDTIRKVLDLQRRILGEDHPETLQSMYDLADVIWKTGRLDEAEGHLKRCLEARRRVLGTAHLSVASTTDSLLRVLRARAKVEEARPYVMHLTDEVVNRTRYGDLHTNPYELSAYAYALLTYEPTEFRDPREGLSRAEKAIEVGGADAPKLRNLVIAYEQNGRLDDAISTLRETIDGLGTEESYWRAAFETRLMHALRTGGRFDEAQGTMDSILARTREAHGDRQAELVRKVTDLTLFLLANGRYLQHEWICNDLVQLQLGSIPMDAPGLVGFVVIYATALVDQGRHAEAEPHLRQCLDIRQSALPDSHWSIAPVMSVLGAALTGQGKYVEAEPLLLDAHNLLNDNAETIPKHFRDDRIREALERIVKLYETWGKPNKAAKYRAALADQDDGRELGRRETRDQP